MKIELNKNRSRKGFVLLLVILLAAVSLIILAGVMNRTSTVAKLNLRNTQINVLDNAAEAAIEKSYARMAWDFMSYGPGTVSANYSSGLYAGLVPTNSDNSYWSGFTFSDPIAGTTGKIYVTFVTNYTGPLPTQFTNQNAYYSPVYRFACNVKSSKSLASDVIGTAQEDVLLAEVPITTYAIFYNGPLEFSGCADMTVSGRVHCNTNLYLGTAASLTFSNLVTSAGSISAPLLGGYTTSSWDPTDPSTWNVTFDSNYKTNYPFVSIAIQMTNTHSIIDIPPKGENVMSQQGEIRLYNEAQVVLIVTNSPLGGSPQVTMTLQTAYNGNLPGADGTKAIYTMTNATENYLSTNTGTTTIQLPFLTLTNSFVDQRQGSSSQFVTDIDVGQYKSWLSTNSKVTGKFTSGNYPTILYVADRRNIGNTQAVVRLSNGSQLPNNSGLGFTVATQNPIYIEGNYNTTTNGSTYALDLGSTTNGASVPAAILADAVTLLSADWTDSHSAKSYSSGPKVSSDMVINAALVTGNVPSTGTDANSFSGGVPNITRFLEDWRKVNLIMNTSIVCLFSSQMATSQFQMPGAYYNPPTRKWGFDNTYYNPDKQPPGVPCALVPIRFNWVKPPPGSVVSN